MSAKCETEHGVPYGDKNLQKQKGDGAGSEAAGTEAAGETRPATRAWLSDGCTPECAVHGLVRCDGVHGLNPVGVRRARTRRGFSEQRRGGRPPGNAACRGRGGGRAARGSPKPVGGGSYPPWPEASPIAGGVWVPFYTQWACEITRAISIRQNIPTARMVAPMSLYVGQRVYSNIKKTPLQAIPPVCADGLYKVVGKYNNKAVKLLYFPPRTRWCRPGSGLRRRARDAAGARRPPPLLREYRSVS
jgi:hypothetical protein